MSVSLKNGQPLGISLYDIQPLHYPITRIYFRNNEYLLNCKCTLANFENMLGTVYSRRLFIITEQNAQLMT